MVSGAFARKARHVSCGLDSCGACLEFCYGSGTAIECGVAYVDFCYGFYWENTIYVAFWETGIWSESAPVIETCHPEVHATEI